MLAAAIIVGVAGYRYFNTAAGNVLLLDLGFDSRFAAVQRDLGARIDAAAARAGVPPAALRVDGPAGGRLGEVAVITGRVPAERSLIQVNAEVESAVRKGGGRVRACAETRDGGAIEMEIGTRRTATHRCVFQKRKREAARPEPQPSARPMIALVVDDFGYFDNRVVRDFLALDVPLAISVIPGLRHSEAIARRARAAGKETICHLPMEPEGDADGGGDEPLVRVDMTRGEIEGIVEKALSTTPGVVGMNNHMGSKATADRRVMEAVLGVCRRHGLFFFDSHTTSHSVVTETAAAVGVPSLRSDFFLDNRGDDVRANMRALLSSAARRGRATGILHVRRENLAHLRWLAQEAEREGVAIVTLSHMLGS